MDKADTEDKADTIKVAKVLRPILRSIWAGAESVGNKQTHAYIQLLFQMIISDLLALLSGGDEKKRRKFFRKIIETLSASEELVFKLTHRKLEIIQKGESDSKKMSALKEIISNLVGTPSKDIMGDFLKEEKK